MGYDAAEAGCALRVSMGPETTRDEVLRFAETWLKLWKRHRARAA
jgi:cysteine desulfurase